MAEARVLLVEDDADQRALVAGMLSREGMLVTTAATIGAALAALEATPVDLVVSDLRVGDGDGLDLLRAVRARHGELPFVLITAYGSIAHAVEALRAGVDDYLAKP